MTRIRLGVAAGVAAAAAFAGPAHAQYEDPASGQPVMKATISGPTNLVVGQDATYTFSVQNIGQKQSDRLEMSLVDSTASNSTVSDWADYISSTCPNGDPARCTVLGPIAPGATKTWSVTIRPKLVPSPATRYLAQQICDDFGCQRDDPARDRPNVDHVLGTVAASGSTGGQGGSGGTGGPDTTAPVISGVQVPAGISRSVLGTGGVAVAFDLSEAAAVTATWQAYRPGVRKRSGGRCTPRSSSQRRRFLARRDRRGKRAYVACTKRTTLGTDDVGSKPAGENSYPLPASVAGKQIKDGEYRIVLTATDAAGNKSAAAKTSRFEVD